MPSLEAPKGLSLAAAVRWGAAALTRSPTPVLDARVLLKAALDIDDVALIADAMRPLTEAEAALYGAFIARRAQEEPVAHITGVREFWSLPIAVEPGMLAPRPDSETLIAAVIDRRDRQAPLRLLDLGCGSGALLCALLAEFPQASGIGVDIDPAAVALANRNLLRLGFDRRARAVHGDWTAPLQERFDVIVSNPPYIAETERGRLPHEVEAFEDPRALFAGADGLEAYRRLARLLPAVIAPGGLLVLEIGQDQAASAGALMSEAFPDGRIGVASDLAGRDRALIIDLDPPAR
ncbi:MAG: peptide chain release factor N(5)-glutamine methyltransferase [Parvularculaceae bacterium]